MASFSSNYQYNGYIDTKHKIEEKEVFKENIKCKKANKPFEYNECLSVNVKELKEENAILMAEYAVETKTTDNIELSKTAIDLLSDSRLKEELTKEINDLEHTIKQAKLKNDIEALLTKAIKSKSESEISKLRTLITSLDDEQLVNGYTKEVNNLVLKIKEEKRAKAAREAEIARLQAIEAAKQQALVSQTNNKKNNTPALGKISGSISAYSPYCIGCGGYVASGKDVRNGNIYYNDKTYGTVRIVAGDSSYPFGTIVKFNNLKGGTMYAVVLDRGGAIGKGRHRLWDLLFNTEKEAYAFGVAYNIEAEILRLGF